jgi:TRAP-type C4-dicarboxylate transport system permease small subunit
MNLDGKSLFSSQRWDNFAHIVGSACNLIAGGSVFFMAAITFGDICGRIFGYAIPSTYEIVELMMAPAVFLSLFYAQRMGNHIRITVIYQKVHGKAAIWLDILASSMGFLVLAITSWGLLRWGIEAWKMNEVAIGELDIPVYPFKILASLGCLMLAITYLNQSIHYFYRAFKSGG